LTDQAELRRRLEPVLALLAGDPASLSSVRDPQRAWEVHVEDSLSGLELVGAPGRLADVGAGAGFPGLVLAAALPGTRVDLIESVGRKAEFIERAIAAAGLDNARAINARSEDWARDPGEEAELARAADRLAMVPGPVVDAAGDRAGAANRHLHSVQKSGSTPPGLPRRPGIAKKRPFGRG
jgi:16S rRNA (guanine527-N7)-methyltransferase